ncbi:hypothetical protein [Alteribacter keqinensis]|uniref:Uncharacterized protein n=1 Tax=Alteribacter keqinensis TaxID=2483800 RepID=A0A3M7TRI6_9BACI|nr:hypothetical protein [Alteribacter keqinensis]RNA66980.1 hypothetical protein EBO34_17450 [Alteribacter keqinensis]
MTRYYHFGGFYVCTICFLFTLQLIYAMTNHTWTVSPPAAVLWLFAAASLVLGILGFHYKPGHVAKIRNWTTVTLSSLLCIVLFLGVLRFLFISEELMKTEHSPD